MSAQQSYVENAALLRAMKELLDANKALLEKVEASNVAMEKTNAAIVKSNVLLQRIVRKKFGSGGSSSPDGGLLGKAASSLLGGVTGGLGMLLGGDPLAKFAQIAQIVTGISAVLLVIGLAAHANVSVSKDFVITTNPNGGGANLDELLTLLREILGALEGREEWFNATDYRDKIGSGSGTWAEKPSLKEMLQAIARQLGVKIDMSSLTNYEKDANGNNIQIGVDQDGPIFKKNVATYWQAVEQEPTLHAVGQLTLEQLAGTLNLVFPLTLDKDVDGKGTAETPEAFALRQDARAATLASFNKTVKAVLAQLNTGSTTPDNPSLTIRDLLKALEINFPPELIENNRLKTAPDLTLVGLGMAAMASGIQAIDADVKASNTALGTIDSRLHSDVVSGGDQNVAEALKFIADSTSSSSLTLGAIYSNTDTALDTLNTRTAATNNSLATLNAKVTATNAALGTINSQLHSSEVNNADQTISHILKLIAAGLGDVETSVVATNTALDTIDGRLHSDMIAFGDQSVALTLKCILNDIQIDNESIFKAIRNILAGAAKETTLASIKDTAESIDAKTVSIDDNISGIAGTIGHGELGDITVYNQLKQILVSAFIAKTDLDLIATAIGPLETNLDQIAAAIGPLENSYGSIGLNAFKINQSTYLAMTELEVIDRKLGGEDPTLFNVVYEMNQKIGEGDACCDEEWNTDGNIVRPDLVDKLPVNATTDGDIRCKRVEMLLDFYEKWMQDFCVQADFTSTMLGFLKDGMLVGSLRGSALGTIKLWAPKEGGLSLLKDPASVAIRYGLGAQITACLPHIIVTLAIVSVTVGRIVHCACVEDFPAMLGLTGSGDFSSLKCTLYNALKEGKTGAEFKALFDAWIDSVVFQGDLTFGFAPATRKAILKAFFPLQAATAFVEGKLINFSAAELLDPNGNPYPGDCGGCGGGTIPVVQTNCKVVLSEGKTHIVYMFPSNTPSVGTHYDGVSTPYATSPSNPGATYNSVIRDIPGTITTYHGGIAHERTVVRIKQNGTYPMPDTVRVVCWSPNSYVYLDNSKPNAILSGGNGTFEPGCWIWEQGGARYSNDIGLARNFHIFVEKYTDSNGIVRNGPDFLHLANSYDPTDPPVDFIVEFDPPLTS